VTGDPAGAILELAAATFRKRPGLVTLGISGAQGSGKSTLARLVAAAVPASAVLSLDDLYHMREERGRLAREVHPLLRTRGVPGTHDLALGHRIIDRLAAGEACRLPRFDKAADDRLPESAWPSAPQPTRLLLLEGWCLGASAQDTAALGRPVNALERDEDCDWRWRRAVNTELAGAYAGFFARIDALVFLAAPGFDVVGRWRAEQEANLPPKSRMDRAALARFVSHYERITRHMLDTLPGRADLTLWLDADRAIVGMQRLARAAPLG
jgi:D-glycerate 3-kinase